MTQNLLFRSDSAALQTGVKAVGAASGKLQKALANIQSVVDVVNCATQYLTVVDAAIDLAKTLAPT